MFIERDEMSGIFKLGKKTYPEIGGFRIVFAEHKEKGKCVFCRKNGDLFLVRIDTDENLMCKACIVDDAETRIDEFVDLIEQGEDS